MCKRTPITACFCNDTNSISPINPFFYADFKVVKTRLISNYGEFAIIKIFIMQTLPSTKELKSVPISKPVRYEKIPVLGFKHIRYRKEILTFTRVEDRYFSILNLYDAIRRHNKSVLFTKILKPFQ